MISIENFRVSRLFYSLDFINWKMINHSASQIPESPLQIETEVETVQLTPYGSARLRISEFSYTNGVGK